MKVLNEPERLGGLFLMVGAASLLFIIVEYITVLIGAPVNDDLAQRAAYFESQYPTASRGWHFEIVAMALVGAGSLVRLDSEAKAGWALAAIGVAAVFPMYPLMIGGYPPAFASAPESTLPYEILNNIAWEIFMVGNMLLHLGLTLAFWLERRTPAQRAPGWVLWTGFAANLGGALGFMGMHAGVPIRISDAGPIALLALLALAVFGAFQAFKREPEPE